MKSVNVVADYREKSSGIPSMLIELGLKVTYQNLSVGDYILPNQYAVERKEAGDFLSSMLSGRLFDQAYRLREAYHKAFFIVEGDIQEVLNGFPKPKALWGALTSLTLRYNGHVFFTASKKQTAELLSIIAHQTTETRPPEPIVKERRKIRTLDERQLHVVASLPGVGLKLADRMLRKFITIRNVFQASSTNLSSVKGLGRSKAEKICELLDAIYKPSIPDSSRQKFLDEKT